MYPIYKIVTFQLQSSLNKLNVITSSASHDKQMLRQKQSQTRSIYRQYFVTLATQTHLDFILYKYIGVCEERFTTDNH